MMFVYEITPAGRTSVSLCCAIHVCVCVCEGGHHPQSVDHGPESV